MGSPLSFGKGGTVENGGVWVCPMTLAYLFGVVVGFTINYPVTLRVPPLLGKKGIGRALVVKRDTINL